MKAQSTVFTFSRLLATVGNFTVRSGSTYLSPYSLPGLLHLLYLSHLPDLPDLSHLSHLPYTLLYALPDPITTINGFQAPSAKANHSAG